MDSTTTKEQSSKVVDSKLAELDTGDEPDTSVKSEPAKKAVKKDKEFETLKIELKSEIIYFESIQKLLDAILAEGENKANKDPEKTLEDRKTMIETINVLLDKKIKDTLNNDDVVHTMLTTTSTMVNLILKCQLSTTRGTIINVINHNITGIKNYFNDFLSIGDKLCNQ
jgi:hypothetical protein